MRVPITVVCMRRINPLLYNFPNWIKITSAWTDVLICRCSWPWEDLAIHQNKNNLKSLCWSTWWSERINSASVGVDQRSELRFCAWTVKMWKLKTYISWSINKDIRLHFQPCHTNSIPEVGQQILVWFGEVDLTRLYLEHKCTLLLSSVSCEISVKARHTF